MNGQIKMTLLIRLYMHTDTETQQFGDQAHTAVCINVSLRISYHYGRPLSVSGRPCYILPMFIYFFIYFFYGRLILRPW